METEILQFNMFLEAWEVQSADINSLHGNINTSSLHTCIIRRLATWSISLISTTNNVTGETLLASCIYSESCLWTTKNGLEQWQSQSVRAVCWNQLETASNNTTTVLNTKSTCAGQAGGSAFTTSFLAKGGGVTI